MEALGFPSMPTLPVMGRNHITCPAMSQSALDFVVAPANRVFLHLAYTIGHPPWHHLLSFGYATWPRFDHLFFGSPLCLHLPSGCSSAGSHWSFLGFPLVASHHSGSQYRLIFGLHTIVPGLLDNGAIAFVYAWCNLLILFCCFGTNRSKSTAWNSNPRNCHCHPAQIWYWSPRLITPRFLLYLRHQRLLCSCYASPWPETLAPALCQARTHSSHLTNLEQSCMHTSLSNLP